MTLSKKIKPVFGIIDYKVNNITSVLNSFKHLKLKFKIITKKNAEREFDNVDALILPGVGSYPEEMQNIKRENFYNLIRFHVLKKKKPILGICLGMQLLTESSEEFGLTKGLSLISGKVVKIQTKKLLVPNVGWNEVKVIKQNPLFANFDTKNINFYHVHSYQVLCKKKYSLAEIDYEKKITVCINKGHIYGVQFHPERSHKNGFQLLLNFEKICNNLI